MESEQEDDITIELNIDHPLNQWMKQQTEGMDDAQFKRFMFRFSRKSAVKCGLLIAGNASRFRRRQIVKALVSAFRHGYHAGHQDGYHAGQEDTEKAAAASAARDLSDRE